MPSRLVSLQQHPLPGLRWSSSSSTVHGWSIRRRRSLCQWVPVIQANFVSTSSLKLPFCEQYLLTNLYKNIQWDFRHSFKGFSASFM